MTAGNQRIAARLVLALFVILGAAWLWRLNRAQKISTDVLDLVPRNDRQPELMLVRSLASQRMGRVVLFAVHPGTSPDTRLEDATQTFAQSLQASGRFDEVVVMSDPSTKQTVAKTIFDRRFDLLFPTWLARMRSAYQAAGAPGSFGDWVANQTADELDAFLSKPEALAFQDLLPSDPILLMPGLVDHLHAPSSYMGAASDHLGLVWALQKDKPLLDAGQQPVFDAIQTAEKALRSSDPNATLQWTGVARFASASRVRIERELAWLNSLSLLLIALVAAVSLSRAHKALNLVPPVVCGLLGAWVVTTLCFERVHILVFVIGSLLGGVAIDYGFYLYLQPPLTPDEPYEGKVRRLLKPLLASALTTVLGFSLLLASDLPLIRQLGVFVSAGLLSALAAAILWFGQLRVFHLPARAFACWRPRPTLATRKIAIGGLVLGAALALIGPRLLTWRDNIDQLEIPTPGLHRNDLAVRSLFGQGPGTIVYLTRGETPTAAWHNWAQFTAWFKDRHKAGSQVFSVAALVPSPRAWASLSNNLSALGDFEPALRAALAKRGFEADAFAPFFESLHKWGQLPRQDYNTTVETFATELKGPSALLCSFTPGACWYASIVSETAPEDPPMDLQTLSTSQLETLNRVFSQYRRSALNLSLVGLGLLGLSVLALYGVRRGVRVFAIPSGACLCTFGALGLAGQTLNLFHLLGAFLGVCLSHNYAIFSTENSLRGEGVPPSIRLSGLTTALSFGVLAFSHIPVVAALGTTVAMEVAFALVIVELEALIPGSGVTQRPGE